MVWHANPDCPPRPSSISIPVDWARLGDGAITYPPNVCHPFSRAPGAGWNIGAVTCGALPLSRSCPRKSRRRSDLSSLLQNVVCSRRHELKGDKASDEVKVDKEPNIGLTHSLAQCLNALSNFQPKLTLTLSELDQKMGPHL